jgi:hypothetical protein
MTATLVLPLAYDSRLARLLAHLRRGACAKSLCRVQTNEGGGRWPRGKPASRFPRKRQQSELHIRHVDTTVIGAKGVLFEDDKDTTQPAD